MLISAEAILKGTHADDTGNISTVRDQGRIQDFKWGGQLSHFNFWFQQIGVAISFHCNSSSNNSQTWLRWGATDFFLMGRYALEGQQHEVRQAVPKDGWGKILAPIHPSRLWKGREPSLNPQNIKFIFSFFLDIMHSRDKSSAPWCQRGAQGANRHNEGIDGRKR